MRWIYPFLFLILSSGCITVTPEQEHLYALWETDREQPSPAMLGVELKTEVQAGFMSLCFPGTGHLYLGEPGWAVFWFFAGEISPFSAPVAAVADTRTVNISIIADAYAIWIEKRKKHRAEHDMTNAIQYACSCGSKISSNDRYCSGCGRRQ